MEGRLRPSEDSPYWVFQRRFAKALSAGLNSLNPNKIIPMLIEERKRRILELGIVPNPEV
jgi:hypothetical protein